ncbi:helix-turn-helix domain-containing protein [Pseudomonadota bacterium]
MDTAFYLHRQFVDFDEYCECARNWELEYRQLDKGRFTSDLLMFGNNRSVFADTRLGRKLKQAGSPPPGLITFGVLANPQINIHWRNLHISGDMIFVFPEGGELSSVTYDDFNVFAVSLSEAKLNETCHNLMVDDFRKLINGAEAFNCDSQMLEELRIWLLSVRQELISPRGPGHGEDYLDYYEQELADRLIRVLTYNHQPMHKQRIRKRESALKVAEDYIATTDVDYLTVPELCAVSRVSERTLEYAFQERYGLTPKRYLLVHRMNNVRKQLRAANPETSQIVELARQNGFWHMSAFSSDYKKLFAELPSETLRHYS